MSVVTVVTIRALQSSKRKRNDAFSVNCLTRSREGMLFPSLFLYLYEHVRKGRIMSVVISAVQPKSCAAKINLKAGDVLLTINGQ